MNWDKIRTGIETRYPYPEERVIEVYRKICDHIFRKKAKEFQRRNFPLIF